MTHPRAGWDEHRWIRWDIVGDDQASIERLSVPALADHALAVFAAVPSLPEAQRWLDPGWLGGPVALRTPGGIDVRVNAHERIQLGPARYGDVIVELERRELPLLLWGRCPARLRDPNTTAETVEVMLRRIVRGSTRNAVTGKR